MGSLFFRNRLEKTRLVHYRFCDDIAILLTSQEQASEVKAILDHFLTEHLKLRLHPEKGGVFSYAQGFDFLGFHISTKGRFPGKSAIARLQERVRTCEDEPSKKEAIQRWEAYFGSGASGQILSQKPSSSPAVKPLEESASELPYQSPDENIPQNQSWPKITTLFLRLFQGNPDHFARAYKGQMRYGYAPFNRALTEADILQHILGKETLGIYLLRGEKVICSCLDIDFDKTTLEYSR